MPQESLKNDFQSAHEAGQNTKILTYMVDGVEHVFLPPGASLESMEKFLPAPRRIVASPQFNDVEGFASYVKEFAEAGSRVFVDDNEFKFTTVFDFHSKGLPAWGDHSASIKMELAHEWQRFKEFDGRALKPVDFAEFLEDNVAYISARSGMTGADLLTMAQTFKVQLKGELQVEDTLSGGLRNLVIKDDSTLKGRDSEGKQISFPEKLHFDLRLFKNHKAYPIEVYLRTRTSKESVTFMIKIPDPKGLVEEAFDKVIEDVRSATELSTIKGSFSGPSHKRN